MRTAFLLVLAVGCTPHLESDGSGQPVQTSDWTLPSNGWESPIGGPPVTLVAEGFAIGEVAPDIRLPDQLGATVSLWQFYGDVVVIDVSTIWCKPCQDLAETTQATLDTYADRGFQYVTIIQQNVEGDVPAVEDAELWADEFGILAPVLADVEDPPLSGDVVPDKSFPGVLVIGRDMRVVEKMSAPVTETSLHAAIDAAL